MNAPNAAYIDHSGRPATSTTSSGTATLTPARSAAGLAARNDGGIKFKILIPYARYARPPGACRAFLPASGNVTQLVKRSPPAPATARIPAWTT
ncbi:hypothetical protein Acy02nite_05240 [Actinoplanes cyaneus]|uniref:Uncharacterized protein n=1 Tax=Actinoplanes cyaneus TaxID=52696 RepID=A0A919IBM9_9ACTN|nr:hypothetical protein Acy02nite_05240 [Actinoplanes cyaneus]